MIDWLKIWDEFEIWAQKRDKGKECSKCGKLSDNSPNWKEQQEKIKKLVNKYIRKMLKESGL